MANMVSSCGGVVVVAPRHTCSVDRDGVASTGTCMRLGARGGEGAVGDVLAREVVVGVASLWAWFAVLRRQWRS